MLVTTTQAAEMLALKPRTLEDLRMDGRGPRFVRLGHRCVRYSHAALADWIASKEVTPARERA